MAENGLKTAKFGGSSLSSAMMMSQVRRIIQHDQGRRAIVVSAPGARFPGDIKMTDLLIGWFEGGAREDNPHLAEVIERFENIYTGLMLPEFDLKAKLDQMVRETRAVSQTQDGRLRDFVLSRGEWLNAQILAHLLNFRFVDAAAFVSFTYGGAYDHERTKQRAAHMDLCGAVSRGAVIPGFYGTNPEGQIVTFPRDGSDISGAIIAALTKSEVYENFSDIDGFLMASPKVVAAPERITAMTYDEARELAFMGASVLQARAVHYAKDADIPIHVRKTDVSLPEGTRIFPSIEEPPAIPITGIAARSGGCVVTVEKYGMDEETGFLARAASVFADLGIGVHNCPGSVDTLSFIVLDPAFAQSEAKIRAALEQTVKADRVRIVSGVTIICVVGRGMAHTPGVAAKITGALGAHGINIVTMNQGSSERNVEIGVLDSDADNAVRALYKAFVR